MPDLARRLRGEEYHVSLEKNHKYNYCKAHSIIRTATEGFTDTLGTFDGAEEVDGKVDGAEEGFVDNEGISDGELELSLTRQRQQTSLALSFPSSAIPAAVAPHRSGST